MTVSLSVSHLQGRALTFELLDPRCRSQDGNSLMYIFPDLHG